MSISQDKNEAETRAELIDVQLTQAGWGVVEDSKVFRERDVCKITKGKLQLGGTRAKPLIADYILMYKGVKLAVIEAKRNNLEYTQGVGQAKLYAKMLMVRYTYSTNGDRIYGIDMDKAIEAEIKKYPSPDDLWAMSFPNTNNWLDIFLSIPFEDKGGAWQPRYYQENAIFKTLEAIANGQNRILLTLATGTGKTAIAFQIAWRLFKSRWNIQKDGIREPRILFLADRNILANQAFNAFSAFDENALVRITPKEIKKKSKVPTNGNVFFTIFQSFMSGEDLKYNENGEDDKYNEDDSEYYFKQYNSDFFDFIIIDECHRGGANDESSWRAIMDYFSPAVQLGLTATPKRKNNTDTYKYFGEPVYIYSLKEGIEDGFLTPFKVKQISSNIDTYVHKEDDEVIDGEIIKGHIYEEGDFNSKIKIEEREKHRVNQFLKEMKINEKTLVFCKTQRHALIVRDLINQCSSSTNADYCHRVTADDGAIGDLHLRDFQDNEKTIPTILTTSQKLSTGVDAVEIKNIVLLRPIISMIEFKQIIGRGTRLFEGKNYFTIYDFVQAHTHFSDPTWDGEPLVPIEPIDENDGCKKCNQKPCICEKDGNKPCDICGFKPCKCEKNPPTILTIKLADGSIRNLNSNIVTTFWGDNGKQITSEDFLKMLFGELPNFFTNEKELLDIWSKPDTRNKLLKGLEGAGYSLDNLIQLQIMLNAQKCDLFDVLSYIAFNATPITRKKRASKVNLYFNGYDTKQQEFLDFILKQYVDKGVGELDSYKLPDLLKLKYHSVPDAKAELGEIKDIKKVFVGFQKYLYDLASA